MKSLISVTTLAIGLVAAGAASAAQDETQSVRMRNITVTAVPASYETYDVDMHTGFMLHALVGHTHRQFVQARRDAERWESQRRRGMATQPLVAVAIDNASGPGVARQFQLLDADRYTVAIVNVYCKHRVPAGTPRCSTQSLPVSSNRFDRKLAATQPVYLQVAGLAPRD